VKHSKKSQNHTIASATMTKEHFMTNMEMNNPKQDNNIITDIMMKMFKQM